MAEDFYSIVTDYGSQVKGLTKVTSRLIDCRTQEPEVLNAIKIEI